MPEFCTCGAQLPEDARFCHKCGKPQREEDAIAEPPPAVTVAAEVELLGPPPIPLSAPISLRDRTAVSTGLMATGVTLLLTVLLGPLSFLAPVAGGLFAVFVYHKRTGQLLTIMNGIRLGWIAGIFFFTITTIFLAIIAAALAQPELAQSLRDQLAKNTVSAEEATKFIEMLQSVSGVASLLLIVFVSSTLLMGLGGFMGALFVRRGTADQRHG